MVILLTGGSGYLGKNFIERASKKHTIIAPTEEEMNLSDMKSIVAVFAKQKVDCVLHLASSNDRNERSTLQADNLIMFKNIQYASILSGVKKLIICGALDEYDTSNDIVMAKESDIAESMPTSAYGLSRQLINLLASKDKITTNLRFFNIYGKYRDVTTCKINQIVGIGVTSKKAIDIGQDSKLSVTYVDDAIDIILQFIANDYPKGDYNIASPEPVTLLEIAKATKSLAKKDEKILDIVVSGTDYERTCDTSKVMGLIKYQFTSIKTGVKKLYEYYMSHKSEARRKVTK